jgi:hypothetical protein
MCIDQQKCIFDQWMVSSSKPSKMGDSKSLDKNAASHISGPKMGIRDQWNQWPFQGDVREYPHQNRAFYGSLPDGS